MPSWLQVALDYQEGDVDLSMVLTDRREKAILSGACPTDAEAEGLSRLLDGFLPAFFQQPDAPIEVKDENMFFRFRYCDCGQDATVECDCCEHCFCDTHAPVESSNGQHFCNACNSVRAQMQLSCI